MKFSKKEILNKILFFLPGLLLISGCKDPFSQDLGEKYLMTIRMFTTKFFYHYLSPPGGVTFFAGPKKVTKKRPLRKKNPYPSITTCPAAQIPCAIPISNPGNGFFSGSPHPKLPAGRFLHPAHQNAALTRPPFIWW